MFYYIDIAVNFAPARKFHPDPKSRS